MWLAERGNHFTWFSLGGVTAVNLIPSLLKKLTSPKVAQYHDSRSVCLALRVITFNPKAVSRVGSPTPTLEKIKKEFREAKNHKTAHEHLRAGLLHSSG